MASTLERKPQTLMSGTKNFTRVDQEMLFEVTLAVNYLDIKQLLGVGRKTVANAIKGKSPEEIRGTFNVRHDSIPEEEEDQIRREIEQAEKDSLPRFLKVLLPPKGFDVSSIWPNGSRVKKGTFVELTDGWYLYIYYSTRHVSQQVTGRYGRSGTQHQWWSTL